MSEEPEILIVDDDDRLRMALARALRLEGFAVRTAADGPQAVRAVADRRPSLMLLDVTMPGADGVAVVRHLRDQGIELPVCILSGRTEVADRVRGLEAGADDYLVKPFAMGELKARIQALLRRGGGGGPATARVVGDLRLDPARRRAWRGSRELTLTRREFDLLDALAAHQDEVLSRGRLLELVWGYDVEAETNVVDVFVGYLRRKLEAGGESRILHTARGVGFRLSAQP